MSLIEVLIRTVADDEDPRNLRGRVAMGGVERLPTGESVVWIVIDGPWKWVLGMHKDNGVCKNEHEFYIRKRDWLSWIKTEASKSSSDMLAWGWMSREDMRQINNIGFRELFNVLRRRPDSEFIAFEHA